MKSIKRFYQSLRVPYLNVTIDEGDDSLPTIVLLHGLAATTSTWNPLLSLIDRSKYRIVAVDLLGFGTSVKPSNLDYNVEQHVAAVRKTLKRLRLKTPYVIVGHSMGSIISARYIRMYPEDVSSAVLVSLPLYLEDYQTNGRISKKLNGMYMKTYGYIRKNPNFTILNAKRIQKLLKLSDGIDITESTWIPFSRSLKNTIEKQRTLLDIADTTVPVTEIHGKLDEVIVPGNMKQLDKIKGVKIVEVSKEDHLITDKFAVRIYQIIDK